MYTKELNLFTFILCTNNGQITGDNEQWKKRRRDEENSVWVRERGQCIE